MLLSYTGMGEEVKMSEGRCRGIECVLIDWLCTEIPWHLVGRYLGYLGLTRLIP